MIFYRVRNKVNSVITLNHHDKVIINGRRGMVGTVRGMAKEDGRNVEEAIERCIKNAKKNYEKVELYWVIQEPLCICGDKGYYEYKRKLWENAITIMEGQIVEIEGELLEVHYKGDYSDMIEFLPIN